eukprot:XP_017949539.1 PREDICTED: flotillin-2-like [Xenopus tropicalis]
MEQGGPFSGPGKTSAAHPLLPSGHVEEESPGIQLDDQHPEVLSSSQSEHELLGLRFDSRQKRVFLPGDKQLKLQSFIMRLKVSHNPKVQTCMRVLGLMVSATEAVPYAQFHHHPLQATILRRWRRSSLHQRISFSRGIKRSLEWWLNPYRLSEGRIFTKPSWQIVTTASRDIISGLVVSGRSSSTDQSSRNQSNSPSPTVLARTLTVEQISQDRDQFAKLVREVAAPDVGRMGIEILSFTIKLPRSPFSLRDVYNKVEYLSSLGKAQTAAVRRDADIGVAEAERDAGIREALCKREMLDVKYLADTKMADSKREFEMQKAGFSQEVNTKKAEAQLAYELQAAKEQQKIRQEEIEIKVVQRKKQIDIEEKEIVRMDKELIATVRRPAEAEAYRMQQIAEGEKVKQVLYAQAEAEKIRKIGDAEAATIKAIGKAEAEKMKLKAGAYQQYGEAAKMAMVLECLPQIAAKVSAPLAKVDEIVILSGDNSKITGEMNRLLAEVPASVQALTGVDLTKIPLIQKATGILA